MQCCEAIYKPLEKLHCKNKSRLKAQHRPGVFPSPSMGKSSSDVLHRVSEYTRRTLTFDSDMLNDILGVFGIYEVLFPFFRHFWGVPIARLKRLVTMQQSDDNRYFRTHTEGVVTGLCWNLRAPSKRHPGFHNWSWAVWLGEVDDNDNIYKDTLSTADGMEARVEREDGKTVDFQLLEQLSKDASNYKKFLPYIHIGAWTIKCRLKFFSDPAERDL